MHIQKTVLKTTNKTLAVIAQSAELSTVDKKGCVQGSLCKKSLWAPEKILRWCNAQHVPVQIIHLRVRKLKRLYAGGGSIYGVMCPDNPQGLVPDRRLQPFV